jgi:ketosteroid isomerase-like protein
MTRFFLGSLTCLLAVMPVAASAASPADALVAFEHARREAVAHVDLAAIDAMTSADLIYVDASGFERDKKAYLDHLATEGVVYNSYSLDDLHASVRGGVGVLSGLFRFNVTVSGRGNVGVQYFTSVYVRNGQGWKLMVWHPTRAAAQP